MLSNLLCKHPFRSLVPVAYILSINHHIWQWTAGGASFIQNQKKKKTFLLTSTIWTWENWPKMWKHRPNSHHAEEHFRMDRATARSTVHFPEPTTDHTLSHVPRDLFTEYLFWDNFFFNASESQSLEENLWPDFSGRMWGLCLGQDDGPRSSSSSSSRKALDCPLD